MGMSWNHTAKQSTEATATGPHMRRSHGANLPLAVGLLRSTIWPIVTSVKASTMRQTIIMVPTRAAEMPMTSV